MFFFFLAPIHSKCAGTKENNHVSPPLLLFNSIRINCGRCLIRLVWFQIRIATGMPIPLHFERNKKKHLWMQWLWVYSFFHCCQNREIPGHFNLSKCSMAAFAYVTLFRCPRPFHYSIWPTRIYEPEKKERSQTQCICDGSNTAANNMPWQAKNIHTASLAYKTKAKRKKNAQANQFTFNQTLWIYASFISKSHLRFFFLLWKHCLGIFVASVGHHYERSAVYTTKTLPHCQDPYSATFGRRIRHQRTVQRERDTKSTREKTFSYHHHNRAPMLARNIRSIQNRQTIHHTWQNELNADERYPAYSGGLIGAITHTHTHTHRIEIERESEHTRNHTPIHKITIP